MQMIKTPAASSIALSDCEAMEFWAQQFGVDLEELRCAVLAVGPRAEDVQHELTGIPPVSH